jgi:hypothetical protein
MEVNTWYQIEARGQISRVSRELRESMKPDNWRVVDFYNSTELDASYTSTFMHGLGPDNEDTKFELIIFEYQAEDEMYKVPVALEENEKSVRISTLNKNLLSSVTGNAARTESVWNDLQRMLNQVPE